MPQKGTYTALQKLKPIDINWGEVAKSGNEREDFLYNRKKAEEAARKKERDSISYDDLAPVITGIDSLDKGLTLGIQEASSLQYEDYKRALNDPTYADSAEYKIRNKNLNSYSKNLKAFSDGFSELAQKVITKSNDDTLSDWDDDLLSTLNGGFVSEKVKFGVGKDGSVVAFIASTDQGEITDENPDGYIYDEDGKIKMTRVTPNEVFKGLGKFSITPDVDINATAIDIGKELGKSITSDINGYTITSEQNWESKIDETRKMVRGYLGTPKSPTPLAKRLWADEMGEKSRNLTEDDLSKMEDKMLEKIKPLYDREVKQSKNFAARTSDRKFNEENKPVTLEVVPDSKTGELEKKPLRNGSSAYAISFGDGKPLNVFKTNSNSMSYVNLYVDNDGDVYADKIYEQKYKGDPILDPDGTTNWGATVAKQSAKGWEGVQLDQEKLSNVELTNLAKNSRLVNAEGKPFKDGKELADFIKGKAKGFKQQSGGNNKAAGDSIFN